MVPDLRQELLTHLLCVCAVFNSAHCEGEKAETTWDFHFATFLSGCPCQLGDKVFGKILKSYFRAHLASDLTIFAEHFIKALNI